MQTVDYYLIRSPPPPPPTVYAEFVGYINFFYVMYFNFNSSTIKQPCKPRPRFAYSHFADLVRLSVPSNNR